jgi:hypothetical protein
MVLPVYFLQVFPIYMCIYLGSGDIYMAQHLLDGPQVRPVFQKMGCERMPECMRAYVFVETGEFYIGLQDFPQPHTRQLPSPGIQKQDFSTASGGHHRTYGIQIVPDHSQGMLAYRYQTFFTAFPEDTRQSYVKQEIGPPEGQQFGSP